MKVDACLLANCDDSGDVDFFVKGFCESTDPVTGRRDTLAE